MKLILLLLLTLTSLHAETLDLMPVQHWIEHTATLKTFRAEFTQQRFLRTLRKPLESTGNICYAAPGSIRWEAGAPANLIATVPAGGALTVQHPDKKQAEVIPRAKLEAQADGTGLAMLESGFPTSMATFKKKFEVLAVVKQGALWVVDAKLAGTGITAPVRKIVFVIQDETWTLNGLQFHFRDGSRVESTFTKLTENAPLPQDCFRPQLDGYEVKAPTP